MIIMMITTTTCAVVKIITVVVVWLRCATRSIGTTQNVNHCTNMYEITRMSFFQPRIESFLSHKSY